MYECVMGLKGFPGAGCILADDMGLGKVCVNMMFASCFIFNDSLSLSTCSTIVTLYIITLDSSIRHTNLDTPSNRPHSQQGTNRQTYHCHLSLLSCQKLG